jgi:hypothetical protein
MLDVHRELELHVANTCNLSCESCSHFSNDGHRGMLAPEEADSWMRVWNKRIRPEYFCLLGGEPTMNPKLVEIVLMAGRNWPESQVSLTTNGFFLEKHPKLPAALQQVRAHLLLSVHHNAPEYVQLLDRPVRLLREWQRQYKFSVYFNDSYHNWTRRYRGRGEAVMPFADNDPRSSWENCRARFCRQLFRGRIWKCSTIAYLQLQKERYPALSRAWDQYLAYQPLDPSCNEEELQSFFAKEEEDICTMCPAKPELFLKPSPLRAREARPNLASGEVDLPGRKSQSLPGLVA